MHHPCLLVGLTIALVAACVPAPKRAYTPDEVENIGDIDEVMRVLAHEADPLFSIRDNDGFTDAELASMVDAGKLIQRAAKGLAEHHANGHGGESFRGFADSLGAEAKKVEDAATAKNAVESGASLSAMKAVCASCHSKHR